ncbi:sugar phosphate isomerase/epimerase family protein [Pigmentibacter ruber]|uniref:sugar phosphate isomerase/epimerase family protein n=1 Tax=Pigmentibacter ruber TaxID=2683196 RepID=UPI00131B8ADE|nr:TIM barrel protein [Pigmentibacter ruber]
MEYCLAINTGFAVNRYSEPEIWPEIIGNQLGIKYVQLTADLLNPDLPGSILASHVNRIQASCKKYNTSINSTFTGAFTRVNHLAHPDHEVRKHWILWFKKFVQISVDLGAESMGSHFGIFTANDVNNPDLLKVRIQQNIEGWHEIAEYAKSQGLKYLTWEPMSIKREQGETIAATKILQKNVNLQSPLPFFICLDVDHGDVTSVNPDDTNPYAWINEFANESPLIHLKQSSANKQGHWPFIEEYNKFGKIVPEKIIDALERANSKAKFSKTFLTLELSFREREPIDSNVISVLKESVAYWRKTVLN